jgi:hypothetical protein
VTMDLALGTATDGRPSPDESSEGGTLWRNWGGGMTEIYVLTAIVVCGALAVLLIAMRS